MKVSFIVPCRDKAWHVAETVDTVLAQTYSPMEIILSDQMSYDGTEEILLQKQKEYRGDNDVRVLQCPHGEYRGMAGLNAHLNWLHEQITGDVVIMCSADDLNHPDRVKYTVEAFEKHNPSYVGTRVEFKKPDGSIMGETAFPQRFSRWIEPQITFGPGTKEPGEPGEAFRHLILSSASSAWARDLYEKHGPLRGIESQDMQLPVMALFERGVYYVDRPLHTYIMHADPNNTGLEGKIRAEEEHTPGWFRALETNNWHNVSHWCTIARRIEMAGWADRLSIPARQAITMHIVRSADTWVRVRDHMTVERIEPRNMVV